MASSRGKHMVELALENHQESPCPLRNSNYNFEVVSNVIIEEIPFQETEHWYDEPKNKALNDHLEQEESCLDDELDSPSKRAEYTREGNNNKHLRLKETTLEHTQEGDKELENHQYNELTNIVKNQELKSRLGQELENQDISDGNDYSPPRPPKRAKYTKEEIYKKKQSPMQTFQERKQGDDYDPDYEVEEVSRGNGELENELGQELENQEGSQKDDQTNSDEDESMPSPSKKAKYTREARYKNKQLRMKGKSYSGLKKSTSGKYHLSNKMPARKLGPACNSDKCKNSKVFFCHSFDENCRLEIFNNFWSKLTWDMKRTYISSLVDFIPAKRQKENSRRSGTLVYFLKKGTQKLRVCKVMFISTLAVGEWMVREYAQKNIGMNTAENEARFPARQRQNKKQQRDTLNIFLEELPKLPSHYCRSSTSKFYLEPIFQSMAELHREYSQYCSSKSLEPLGFKMFNAQFKSKNLQLFRPRKDQCDVCIAHKLGNIDDDTYKRHQDRKDQARSSKEADKERCLTNPHAVALFTVDVQAVKLCPMLKASALYYKTKLCVHNYTTYDLSNSEVICHLWDETQGGLEANIFATMFTDLLEQRFSKEPNTEEIIIYSDGCGYQNKNGLLANALLKFAIEHKITIIQKYFEKGHSQMEVDSVHSTIERKLKNREIYLPTDYIAVCREARTRHPYHVKYMNFSDFRDYSKVTYYSSIRPGIKTGDPQVTDVHCLMYSPEGIIKYKLCYTDEWKNLPKRPKAGQYNVGRLYRARQKIKGEKYNHLQQLKMVLSKEFWPFYDELPH